MGSGSLEVHGWKPRFLKAPRRPPQPGCRSLKPETLWPFQRTPQILPNLCALGQGPCPVLMPRWQTQVPETQGSGGLRGGTGRAGACACLCAGLLARRSSEEFLGAGASSCMWGCEVECPDVEPSAEVDERRIQDQSPLTLTFYTFPQNIWPLPVARPWARFLRCGRVPPPPHSVAPPGRGRPWQWAVPRIHSDCSGLLLASTRPWPRALVQRQASSSVHLLASFCLDSLVGFPFPKVRGEELCPPLPQDGEQAASSSCPSLGSYQAGNGVTWPRTPHGTFETWANWIITIPIGYF